MDPEQIARDLFDAATRSGEQPNSTAWWLAIGQRVTEIAPALSPLEGNMAAAIANVKTHFPNATEIDDAPVVSAPPSGETEVSGGKPDLPDGQDARLTPEDGAPALTGAGYPIGHRSAAHRVICSQRSAMRTAVVIDRRWNPALFGYTADDFRADYPTSNGGEVLESFLSHFIAKGETSKNWLEKFWRYAALGEQMQAERNKDRREQDSMGFPLDQQARVNARRETDRKWSEQDQYLTDMMAEEQAAKQAQIDDEQRSNHQ